MSEQDGDQGQLFPLLLGSLIAVLTLLPVFYAYARAPDGMHFMGIVKDVCDANTYFDYMNQATEGRFFFYNSYTAEPMRPLLIRPLFWTMGIVSLVLPAIVTWHLFRVLFVFAFCSTLYWFVGLLTPSLALRRMALIIAAVGAGFGYYSLLLEQYLPRTFGAVDLWQAEAIPFLSFSGPPHFTLSLVLIMLVMGHFHTAVTSESSKHAIWAGAVCCLLGFVHIYDVVTIFAVTGAFLISLSAIDRALDWRRVRIAALFYLLAIPSFVYYYLVFTSDPIFSSWTSQNLLTSPPALDYLLGFGLVLILAVVGLGIGRLQEGIFRDRASLLLGVWLGVNALLLYFPVSFQRRLIEGLFVPTSILAAGALFAIGVRLRRRGASRVALLAGFALVLMLIVPTNVYTTIQLFSPSYDPAGFNAVPYYLSEDELAVLHWLEENTSPDQVVLGTPRLSNYVPRISANKIVAGHWAQTIDYRGKMRWYRRFVRGHATDREISARGIDYIILRKNSPYDLPIVYTTDTLLIAEAPPGRRRPGL